MDRSDAEVAFARCLRDHGLDVQEPRPGGDGPRGIAIQGRPGDERKMLAAQRACRKLAPGGFKEPTPEEQEKLRDAALAFAQCMRKHGVDLPDPQTNGGGILMRAPRQRNRDIPADLETVVLKALAKEPQRRYGTAKEMADDLRRFLEQRPILARRPTTGRPPRR